MKRRALIVASYIALVDPIWYLFAAMLVAVTTVLLLLATLV